MITRRASIGLSLLCALVFCSFAAQSASAKGTTEFTCVKGVGAAEPFKDPHCDEEVPTKEGYKHEAIAPGTKTLADTTNEKTSHETKVTEPWFLRGEAAGIKVEIQCTSTTGKITTENKEIEKVMQVEGTKGSAEFTKCTVLRPENAAEERHPCKVKEPIVWNNTSITRENLGASGKEMGIETKPEGEAFTKITFEGVNCPEALKKEAFAVTGTIISTGGRGSSLATPSTGATFWYTTAMTSETLKFAGKVAETKTTVTPTMYNEATKETENPLIFTTTEP